MKKFLIGIGVLVAPFLVAGIVTANQQPTVQSPPPPTHSHGSVPPGKGGILV